MEEKMNLQDIIACVNSDLSNEIFLAMKEKNVSIKELAAVIDFDEQNLSEVLFYNPIELALEDVIKIFSFLGKFVALVPYTPTTMTMEDTISPQIFKNLWEKEGKPSSLS